MTMRTRFWVGTSFSFVAVAVAACSSEESAPVDAPEATVSEAAGLEAAAGPEAEAAEPAPADPIFLATATSLDGLPVGATLGQFRAKMADYALAFVPTYMVDWGALCAEEDGETLFCAAFPEMLTEPEDSEIIEFFLSTSPRVKTAEGVGAGTSLKDAEAAYGPVTLFYSWNNEGREYASFADGPKIGFRSGNAAGDFSMIGTYPSEGQAEFEETSIYAPGATIAQIEISQRPD